MTCRALAALAAVCLPLVAAASERVGPETCKACHPSAYASWRESAHARALDDLPERSRKDRRCLSCHDPDADAGLAAVTCETCHGAGQAYSAWYVMRDPELARAVGLLDPGERTCLGCHTESTPSLRRFEYGRKLALIAHGLEREAPPAKPAGPPAAPPAR